MRIKIEGVGLASRRANKTDGISDEVQLAIIITPHTELDLERPGCNQVCTTVTILHL